MKHMGPVGLVVLTALALGLTLFVAVMWHELAYSYTDKCSRRGGQMFQAGEVAVCVSPPAWKPQ